MLVFIKLVFPHPSNSFVVFFLFYQFNFPGVYAVHFFSSRIINYSDADSIRRRRGKGRKSERSVYNWHWRKKLDVPVTEQLADGYGDATGEAMEDCDGLDDASVCVELFLSVDVTTGMPRPSGLSGFGCECCWLDIVDEFCCWCGCAARLYPFGGGFCGGTEA